MSAVLKRAGGEVRRRRENSNYLIAAFELHRADLVRFARRRLFNDPLLAEDVVQEAFLRAWRSRDRFDPETGDVRAWLFTICRNTCVDLGVRQSRLRLVDSNDVGAADGGIEDGVVEQLWSRPQAHAALDALSAPRRAAVVAIHVDNRPYAEVAREFGVPVGTVKSRVHLGLLDARRAIA